MRTTDSSIFADLRMSSSIMATSLCEEPGAEKRGWRSELRQTGNGWEEKVQWGPEAHPVSENQEPAGRAAPRRILVADDNADSASSMALLLEILGNEVRTAFDGLEAVEVAAAFRPDVILLDIGMPRLDGYDACRRIREQPWGRDVVLIALTGWSQEEDVRQSRDAGFDHHLVKPVEPATLEKVLAAEAPVR